MKTIAFVFILGIIVFPQLLLSQYSFETIINSEKSEGLNYTFETNNGSYISVGYSLILSNPPGPYSPMITEINDLGEIILNYAPEKTDTSYTFFYGLEKPNGNFFFIGSMSESGVIHKPRIIYVCEMTPDMDLVWEKFHPMQDEVRKAQLLHFLTMPDNTILFQGKADTSLNYFDDFIFTGLLDMNGNLLDFHLQIDPWWAEYGVYSDFIFNFDTTAIYAFGDYVRSVNNPVSFFEMDFDFNITNYLEYIDGEHLTGNTSVAWLPNGNLILADRENNYGGKSEGLLVKLLDPNFNFIQDTFMVRPGMVYVPVFNGLDYNDPDNIWIATFNAMGSYLPNEVFHVQVFDSELNLKGVKVFGENKKQYWFNNLLATSDGGCLITGKVPACDTCENNNGYLFKVMPEVIVSIKEQASAITCSVEVFPNPVHENVTVRSDKKGLFISIHDFTGKKVMESELQNTFTNLNTNPLSKGIYFYKIFEQGKVIKYGKLIKQ